MKDKVTTEAIKATRNLREIKRLYRELGSQIIADGISRDIADSDALNFLGPVAKDSQWEAAYDAAEALADERDETFVDYAQDQLGENHPLGVLTYWDDLVRLERDQPTSLKATVNRGADYLRDRADWMFGETEGEANFIGCMQFAADLKQCRAALENVLRDGVRAEWTRVNCTAEACDKKPRLMRIYGARVMWDGYKCPACKTSYDHKQFVSAKAQNLHSDGAARFVRPIDAMKASDVPKKTMHSWMTRGNVQTAYEVPGYQRLVWWPDVRTRAVERTVRLKIQAVKRAARKAKKESDAVEAKAS